jgi:hypothetical protein
MDLLLPWRGVVNDDRPLPESDLGSEGAPDPEPTDTADPGTYAGEPTDTADPGTYAGEPTDTADPGTYAGEPTGSETDWGEPSPDSDGQSAGQPNGRPASTPKPPAPVSGKDPLAGSVKFPWYLASDPKARLMRRALVSGGAVLLFMFWQLWPKTPPAPSEQQRNAAASPSAAEARIPAGAMSRAEAGRAGGLSYGEPHLVTHDGLHYGFQAVGEFVLVRSADGRFEIQVRQRPPFSAARHASMNSAVAARVGDHRVAVYATSADPELWIDGAPATAPVTLEGGGGIDSKARGWVISWADGSMLTANVNRAGAIDLSVVLSAGRAAQVGGLLGDFDGISANDLTTRDGRTTDPSELNYDFLYRVFGNSWRIAQADSLFDYEPGESTTTFTDLTFPDAYLDFESLAAAARDQAEEQCHAAAVAIQPFIDACRFDVAVTGNAAFAASSVWAAAQLAEDTPVPPGDEALLASSAQLAAPAIGVDATGNVHATWVEGLTSEGQVTHRLLVQAGTWSEANVLSEGMTYSRSPQLLTGPDGGACLMWWGSAHDTAGLFRRCNVNGSWTPAEPILAGLTGEMTPVVTDDGAVHVLHAVPPSGVVVDERELNPGPAGVVFDAAIAASAQGLHVVWLDGRLRYRSSGDGGATWSQALDLAARGWTRVDVAADDSGGLHVVFDGVGGLTYLHRGASGEWNQPEIILPDDIAAERALVIGRDLSPDVLIARADGIELVERTEHGWAIAGVVAAAKQRVAEVAATVDREGRIHLLWITAENPPAVRYFELSRDQTP